MNRNSRQLKRFSSVSYATCTTDSTTTSRFSTIWGPGTLTGKALEAFGEATLRGVENIVVRRKLAFFRSAFPHDNETMTEDIVQIYENVLELTRPGLYSKGVRQIALQLLLPQIDSRNTCHLIQALEKWPEIEIRFFLSQVMSTYMYEVGKWNNASSSREVRRKLQYSAPTIALQLVSMMDFIADLAERNVLARQAALDGGFLDMMLCIYVNFPTFYLSEEEKITHRSALLEACKCAFSVLSGESLFLESVLSHPVHSFWLGDNLSVINGVSKTPEQSLEDRCLAWRRIDPWLVKRRLMALWSTSVTADSFGEEEIYQSCTDMVEFSRPQYYDPEVVKLALLTLFKWMVAGGTTARQLVTVLTRSSCDDIKYIASSIIQLWLEYAAVRDQSVDYVHEPTGFLDTNGSLVASYSNVLPNPSAKVDSTFYGEEKTRLFSGIEAKQSCILPRNDRSLLKIVHFFTQAAQQSITARWGLVEAGTLSLVLMAFVDGVPILSDLFDTFRRPITGPKSKRQEAKSRFIPLDSINSEACSLLDTIQTPAFQAVLRHEMFSKRKRMCRSLLDAILGRYGCLDDEYSEIRMVLDDILE